MGEQTQVRERREPRVGDVYGWSDEFMSKCSAAKPNERYKVIAVEEGKVRFSDSQFAYLSQMKDFRLVSPAPTPPVEASARTEMTVCPHDCGGGWWAGSVPLMNDHLNRCPKINPAAPPVPEKRAPVVRTTCSNCESTSFLMRRTQKCRRPVPYCDRCWLKREEEASAFTATYRPPITLDDEPAPWRPGDSAIAAARGAKPCWRTRGGRW